jgi:hypothetical protein
MTGRTGNSNGKGQKQIPFGDDNQRTTADTGKNNGGHREEQLRTQGRTTADTGMTTKEPADAGTTTEE